GRCGLVKHSRRYRLRPTDYIVQKKTVNARPEVYVVLRTAEAAKRVLDASLANNVDALNDAEIGTVDALKFLQEDASIDVTTRERLTDARLGQGRFSADLISRFEGACAVTGCSFQPLLRASHIKPWSESTNAERLDPENGLLLTANLDALFDRFLISFSNDAAMQTSPHLPRDVPAHLGPIGSLPLTLTAKQREYLSYHSTRLRG